MAYIDASTTKNIRDALKAKFPGIKFSVSKRDYMALTVSVMSSPYFEDNVNFDVNKYYIKQTFEGKQQEFLNDIVGIIQKTGNWYDNSNSQIDHFDTAFYFYVTVGKWNNPHKKI